MPDAVWEEAVEMEAWRRGDHPAGSDHDALIDHFERLIAEARDGR